MKEKNYSILFYIGLGLTALIIIILSFSPRKRAVEPVAESERLDAYLLLLEDLPEQAGDYLEYQRRHDGAGSLPGEPALVESLHEKGMEYKITVETPGLYVPEFHFRRLDGYLGNFTFELLLNGNRPFNEAYSLELNRSWRDQSKNFTRDRYNDEAVPLQVPSTDWQISPLFDNSGRLVDPLALYLTEGEHSLVIRNLGSTEVEIAELKMLPRTTRQTYSEYRSAFPENLSPDEPLEVRINAIDYIEKNSYNVRLGSYDDPSLTPYHNVDKLLNVVDGTSWDSAGEEVVFELEVPEEGDYAITLHYNNPNSDFSVFRSLRIDGEIPFREMEDYEFPTTGVSRWDNLTLSDEEGNPFLFRLSGGKHTLSLKAEKEPVTEATRALNLIIAHMNFFGIEIMKVTGKNVDEFRTWRLTDYLPKTADYLDAYHILITHIIEDLAAYSSKGVDSSATASLHTALFKIEKLAEDPDELPVYLKDIYSTSIYDRPITQTLGDTVSLLEIAGMSLDEIYVETAPADRRANAGILKKTGSSISSLMSTFTSEKYVTRNDEEVLNVWVTRPITHTDIMQKMADAEFTAKTGIEVKISVMPDHNRLLLATAAETTPDIAMGLPSYVPFDLAIRGAALDLTGFEDFWEISSSFSPGAFIPYIVNEEVFGMPETLDFHTLVYRSDIFKQLELTPPDTWDDVIDMLPVLQRYGMNFYHPVAGGLPTLKWFYQTVPFVYQFGGSLFHEDGLSVSLDDPRTVEGLRFLSDLFYLYALQEEVPRFYNSFRFGVVPVGIVDSQSYLQLKYAAPELKGQWNLAPYPGIPDENGDPQRWFIANGVAALIMAETEYPEESWEFLKWWLSEQTQTDFGYRLQATYGPEFLWISANLDALRNAPIDDAEKEVILEQVRWQRDVPRTPATYMLERGLSDIWIKSATQNKSVRNEIDKMIPVIDREVTRKMIEFGFIDIEGNTLKPFIVPHIQWVKDQMEPYTQEADGE